MSAIGTGVAASPDFQTAGTTKDNLPVMAAQIKSRLTFPLGWNEQVKNLAAWRKAGVAKAWELTWQAPDKTPFDAQVIDEVDRGTYVARKVVFNITADSRVSGLLLLPKGKGPFPAAVFYHDHGSKFDIGKEKWIEPWGDDAKLASAKGWAKKFFTERFPGDELAKRGYVVFASDALGWGDRAGMTYDMQQALAANMFNMGSSMAGLMALEDARAAEFLASLPEVNKKQVAAVGFSMGAFRAWQAAALSDAVTASVAVNWMATADGLMVPGNNQLRGGSAWQMLHPGLLHYLDYPDVASLAAPKPMLIYAGEKDTLFPLDSVNAAFGKMSKVWGAWKAADKFESKIWAGGHVFEAPQQDYAYDWLDRQFGIKR
ncbi:dienelactone hydrolase family protein [Uliginosibacterium sp. 31-16]|uniref:dienelactone hydrolase family protein n=1 Tax=Uliginosibacterium sp. 31-16 TaxID=3068315 RepID=UPI00273E1179|nr:dienelactone hydrolase family protein [Uliginosibacterium sp. 31-16]MDP5241163.1 dienelactone hydrolase family protein [Uliginosibacterium sp. 31-16]